MPDITKDDDIVTYYRTEFAKARAELMNARAENMELRKEVSDLRNALQAALFELENALGRDSIGLHKAVRETALELAKLGGRRA